MEALYLLIIEKDAVFYRLMEAKLFHALPVILLSGFGFPSAAARSLASAICHAAAQRNGGAGPPLQVFGVVDYNPSGVQILLQYMNAERHEESQNINNNYGGGGATHTTVLFDDQQCVSRDIACSPHRSGATTKVTAKGTASASAAQMDISQAAFLRGELVHHHHHLLLGTVSSSSPSSAHKRQAKGGLANLRWLGVLPHHCSGTSFNNNTHKGQRQMFTASTAAEQEQPQHEKHQPQQHHNHHHHSSQQQQPLTDRDRRMLSNMLKNAQHETEEVAVRGNVDESQTSDERQRRRGEISDVPHRWRLELRTMQQNGVRFDIEAWYHNNKNNNNTIHNTNDGGVTVASGVLWADLLAQAVVRGDGL